MTLAHHVAGLPLEEWIVPLLAGSSGTAMALRVVFHRWRWRQRYVDQTGRQDRDHVVMTSS
jgi:hypothetical protein